MTITEKINDVFNISDFMKFLNDNNILSVAIATILSNKINDISEAFINNLVLPIINRDIDNDNRPDIKKLEEYTLRMSGIKFELGKFMIALIKFLIITYIVYLLSKLVRKIDMFDR